MKFKSGGLFFIALWLFIKYKYDILYVVVLGPINRYNL